MTAEAQLERLLWLIPAASGKEGLPLGELAAAMGSTVEEIMRDVEALTARAFYHPPSGADDLQVLIEEETLHIWTGGELKRPARLTVREALALGIGLRAAALKHGGNRSGRMLRLARRLEEELAGVDVADLDRSHEVDLGEDPESVRPIIERAARERRPLRIDYLKSGASEPETREILPYALVHAEGAWYVLGENRPAGGDVADAPRDGWRGRLRTFRVDRVLAAMPRPGTFEVPADFDVEEHLTGARVYRPAADAEAMAADVLYRAPVARWIRERLEADPAWALSIREGTDGAVIATHRVTDLEWLVGHVLQYGPDAEVLAPAEARARVAAVALAIARE